MLDVSDIMTPRQNLVVMRPESTVEEVRRAMAANKIRHLPVLDGAGTLVGLVSQTDVLVAGNGEARVVREIMIRDPETVDERENVRHAALLMVRRKRSCLPVTREGELRGIVTDSDFLGVAITLMEQSEAVEPDAEDFESPDEL
ncbi:CBS domain-containing protein [Thioalkalivibrio sp.]|uniref:CBS domain-containing protein n=1 Tax=Thioalkalivibrio sp. TaxID=2093813 RepID=UPI00356348D1